MTTEWHYGEWKVVFATGVDGFYVINERSPRVNLWLTSPGKLWRGSHDGDYVNFKSKDDAVRGIVLYQMESDFFV